MGTKAKPDNQPIRTTDETGAEILVYPDGTIKNASDGKFIQPTRNGGFQSAGAAAEANRIRWEKQREKVREEIKLQAEDIMLQAAGRKPGTPDDVYAFGVGAVFADTVLNADAHNRDRIDAVEVLGRVAGFIPGNTREEQPQSSGDIAEMFSQVPPGGLMMLVRKIRDEFRDNGAPQLIPDPILNSVIDADELDEEDDEEV